jgi:hypothetical protein
VWNTLLSQQLADCEDWLLLMPRSACAGKHQHLAIARPPSGAGDRTLIVLEERA